MNDKDREEFITVADGMGRIMQPWEVLEERMEELEKRVMGLEEALNN